MVRGAPATGPEAHPAPLGAEEPADVVVGRIARPFGRRGEVVVEPLTEDPRRFFDLAAAEVGPAGGDGVRRTLDSVRIHKGRPVVRFSGVTDISGAESLRASEVRIRPSERAPLSESRYYHDDLVGCRAESREGEPLGEIIAVEDTAGPSLLVLRTPAGSEDLVPFVEALCVVVDIERARVVLDLPEGLLGLNGHAD